MPLIISLYAQPMSLVISVGFPSGGITIYQLNLSPQIQSNLEGLTLRFYLQINKSNCSLNMLILKNDYYQFDTDNFTKYEDLVS